MKEKMYGVLFAAIIILMSIPSHAGNIDTFGIGAKATALGGAFAAQADDPFALYYNPAGMSWVTKKKFSMGLQVLIPDLSIEDFHVVSQTQQDLGEHEDPLLKNSKDFSNDAKGLFVPCMGFSMPINDKLSAGFAVYVPWGVELEFDSNPVNNPAAFNAYHVYMAREVFTPGISYRVNDKLSVGFGLSFGKSHTGLEKILYIASDLGHIERQAKAITEEDIFGAINAEAKKADPNAPEINTASLAAAALYSKGASLTKEQKYLADLLAQLSLGGHETSEQIAKFFSTHYDGEPGKDHGSEIEVEMFDHFNISYNLGLLYQATPTTRLGLTYRSQTKEGYQGEFKVVRPDQTVDTMDAMMDYKQPDQLQWGIRYQPHDKLSFEMDMVWTQWSIMDRQVTTLSKDFQVHTLPGNEVLDSETVTKIFDLERKWVDTIQKRFGMEWYAKDWLTLRLGYFYDPTPVPDETMDFQWPDGDKKIYSLGMGINGSCLYYNDTKLNLDNINLDIVFQYGKSEYKRYLGGESHNMNESYDLTEFYHRRAHLSASGQVWGFGCSINYTF
ncbi:MAG: outer membrane protein transport protein [Candidatus Magnetomorum sp.]|nr:outer membrane protein transport protein [Candidatus Magnetomorum sp.]